MAGCKQHPHPGQRPYLHPVERALSLKGTHAQLEVTALKALHGQRHVLNEVGAPEKIPEGAVLQRVVLDQQAAECELLGAACMICFCTMRHSRTSQWVSASSTACVTEEQLCTCALAGRLHVLCLPLSSSRPHLLGEALAKLLLQGRSLGGTLQEQASCVGGRNLCDVEAGGERLADAIQHREAAHDEGEGGREAEGPVCCCLQQVLACTSQLGVMYAAGSELATEPSMSQNAALCIQLLMMNIQAAGKLKGSSTAACYTLQCVASQTARLKCRTDVSAVTACRRAPFSLLGAFALSSAQTTASFLSHQGGAQSAPMFATMAFRRAPFSSLVACALNSAS